jgi:RNA polymerase sigma factor (sigma-70 family)
VLAICRRLLRDSVEAEDAAQQTFLSAQRALQNGSRPREPVAWLATIARNECVARARVRSREPLPTDSEPTATSLDAHSEAVRRESVESLRDAIGSLPDQQREAILLREMRGLSYDEVASSLALTPAAVESLLFRARKGLRLRLRGAATALSPVGWLASLRDLSAQVAAGGDSVAGPTAKVVAIGIGTAVIAGGALVGPSALRHGGHHAQLHATPPKTVAVEHRAAAAVTQQAAATPVAPATPAAPTADQPTRVKEPERQAADDGVVASRPGSFRTPAALRADDESASPKSRSGEGEHATVTIWPTTTTEHEDFGSASSGGGDVRRLSSDAVASTTPPQTDAQAQNDSPGVKPSARHESESTDSGSEHEDGAGGEGGD